jgi:hypothetical protein
MRIVQRLLSSVRDGIGTWWGGAERGMRISSLFTNKANPFAVGLRRERIYYATKMKPRITVAYFEVHSGKSDL